MAKNRSDQMTYRQLQMLEMKAEGKTYKEIGAFFDITGTGAQQNIFAAAVLLKRYGYKALPDGSHPDHSVEELINAVPKARDLPLTLSVEKKTVPSPELRVPTPPGDIAVSSKSEEFTHLAEHENVMKKIKKLPLSQAIQNASAKAGQSIEMPGSIDRER